MIEACDSAQRTISPSQTDISPSCYCGLMQSECNSGVALAALIVALISGKGPRLAWWGVSSGSQLLRDENPGFNQRASRMGSPSRCSVSHRGRTTKWSGGWITHRRGAAGWTTAEPNHTTPESVLGDGRVQKLVRRTCSETPGKTTVGENGAAGWRSETRRKQWAASFLQPV